jgi:tRNA(Arg) A34 adenosine deaminase TadA
LKTYGVGFTAPTILIHGLIHMMPKDSQIINLSGTFENGAKGWLPYYSSKKALEALTYGLAEELMDRKIYVNGISPSDTATEAYKKWFPEYIEEAIEPKKIAEKVIQILKSKKTGTIQVIKKYDYSEEDISFLKKAIQMSMKSYDSKAFPAGAVITKDNRILAKATSTKHPQINLHAVSKVIDEVIEQQNEQLSDYILYASMEPCLMCLSRAYWAGVRKIFFAIKKEAVPYRACYESNHNHYGLLEKFNEKIELVHIQELESLALKPVNKWLMKNT